MNASPVLIRLSALVLTLSLGACDPGGGEESLGDAPSLVLLVSGDTGAAGLSLRSVNEPVKIYAEWIGGQEAESVQWFDWSGKRLETHKVKGREGRDSLLLDAPAWPGRTRIVAVLTDVKRRQSRDTAEFEIYPLPTADAGPDTQVTIRDTVRLRGREGGASGRDLKYEWDLGNRGLFVNVRDTVVVSREDIGYDFHVLRVTDEFGHSDLDTVRVTVRDDIPVLTVELELRREDQGGGFRLVSRVSDAGRIVKWEWDIGGTGDWVRGSAGDTGFIPTQPAGTLLKCRVRATDDDGRVAEANTEFLVSKWSYVESIPQMSLPSFYGSIDEYSLVELNGSLYLFAETSSAPDIFLRYDFSDGAWKPLATPPIPGDGALAASNGKLYLFGGRSLSSWGQGSKTVYSYEPKLDEWTRRADMPAECLRCEATVVGDKVLLMGFDADNSNRDRDGVYEFNTAQETWTERRSMPAGTGSIFSGAAHLDGKLLVAGGDGNLARTGVMEYSLADDAWTSKEPLPADMPYADMVVADGTYYLLGGNSDKEAFHLYAYAPATDAWIQKSDALDPCRFQPAVVVAGRIYAVTTKGHLIVYDPELE